MSNSRRHHPRGPTEAKNVTEFIDDMQAYMRGLRNEYRHDLSVMVDNEKLTRQLRGQLAVVSNVLLYLRDAKKQYRDEGEGT